VGSEAAAAPTDAAAAARKCSVPQTAPTEGLTKIPADGWCFYKAILAAPNNAQTQIYTEAKHDKGKAGAGAQKFARLIAKTILENPEELTNFKYLFGKSIKTNVLDENGTVRENVTLTSDEYLVEMQNPPTKPDGFPRVYGEGVPLLQAAARVVNKKIAIYGENGSLVANGCPKEETDDVISLKFVGGNHFDVFLPAGAAIDPDEINLTILNLANPPTLPGQGLTKIFETRGSAGQPQHRPAAPPSALGTKRSRVSGGHRKRRRTPKRRPKGHRGRRSRKLTFRRHRKH